MFDTRQTLTHRLAVKLDLRFVLPIAALALGAVGAFAIVKTAPKPDVIPPVSSVPLVRAVTIEFETFRHRVRTHGTVTPRTESDLTAEVSGRVIWISPSLVSGGYFERDEALLRIDPHDYKVALELARANLTRSESQVVFTDKELQRQQNLAGRSVASESNLDTAVNAAHSAEAGLREARAVLSQAERDLERTEIPAPYDGRVRGESVDVGQWVTRGSPIAKLYAVDYAEVRLPIPDDQLAFLDVPLMVSRDSEADAHSLPIVELRADFAGALRVWQGRVVRTEGEIDPRTRMMYVVARVEDPYRRAAAAVGEDPENQVPLAVGLFVEAEIIGREARDVVVLPRSAVRDGDQVYVIDDESRLRFREVEVIRRQRDTVVIGAGLTPGERVCTSPMLTPVNGMRVRVAGEESRS